MLGIILANIFVVSLWQTFEPIPHLHDVVLTKYRWERAQELLIADPSISKTIGSSYEALPLLVAVMNKVSYKLDLRLVHALVRNN